MEHIFNFSTKVRDIFDIVQFCILNSISDWLLDDINPQDMRYVLRQDLTDRPLMLQKIEKNEPVPQHKSSKRVFFFGVLTI